MIKLGAAGLDCGALFRLQRCQLDKLGFLSNKADLLIFDKRKAHRFANVQSLRRPTWALGSIISGLCLIELGNKAEDWRCQYFSTRY